MKNILCFTYKYIKHHTLDTNITNVILEKKIFFFSNLTFLLQNKLSKFYQLLFVFKSNDFFRIILKSEI